MSLAALALAAALSIAAPDPAAENEKDLRCVAVVALVASNTEDETKKAFLAAGMMYFIGRIEGRTPGYDLEVNLRRLALSPDFAKVAEGERQRCADMMTQTGTMLQGIGKRFTEEGARGN